MKKILLSLCLITAFANAQMIRIDNKEIVIDTKKMLMWQDNSDAEKVKQDWQGAIKYCQNLIIAGYDDWRLPNIDELFSIRDEDREDCAINNSFLHVVSSKYWSSSSVYRSEYAWDISFENGDDNADIQNSYYSVRCVRNNQ